MPDWIEWGGIERDPKYYSKWWERLKSAEYYQEKKRISEEDREDYKMSRRDDRSTSSVSELYLAAFGM